MASNIPKFGDWEGGANFTVCFDKASEKKTNNGRMINPNDPQDDPDMFRKNNGGGAAGQSSRAADQKKQPSNVPEFGGWLNGENNVSYTEVFKVSNQKNKTIQPVIVNETPMNRDMQPQARPQLPKSQPHQKGQPKVPKFGAWVAGEGDVRYTEYFDNVMQTNLNGRTVTPAASNQPLVNKEGPANAAKVPPSGAWDKGNIETASKKKSTKPVIDQVPVVKPPQLNRDVNNNKAWPQQDTGSTVPKFGEWEAGEGNDGFTKRFDVVRNNNKNRRTITAEPCNAPPANNKEGHAKISEVGKKEEGNNDGVGETNSTRTASKKKNAKTVLDQVPVKPQLNRDVKDKAQPSAAAAGTTKNKENDHHLRNRSKGVNASVGISESAAKNGKQNPVNQSPIHQKPDGKFQQKPPNRKGQNPKQGSAVPEFGVWVTDPAQAERFTDAFVRVRDERNAPVNINNPPPDDHRSPNDITQDDKKKGCFHQFGSCHVM